ncbi:MAG: PAS domain-containing protein [Janthinobacterium lividum]
MISLSPEHEHLLSFLKGGSGMSARILAHDWSTSPLGPPETWPQPLKTAVGISLNAGHPICLAWGKELTFLYNDAYAPALGARHPAALGQPIAQVWQEIWQDIDPLVARALAGESIWLEDMHLVMTRNGYPEDTWWTFSYGPLRDETGAVAGFIDICNDSTAKVLSERRLTAERDRQRFRVELADMLRGRASVADIMDVAAVATGTYLKVDHACFYLLDAGHFVVTNEWHTASSSSAIGRHPVNALGDSAMVASWADNPVRIDDTRVVPGTALLAQAGMAAVLSTPVHRDCRWTGGLHVHQCTPRCWSDDELALLADVAERVWNAIERLHAESKLRHSENRLSAIFSQASAGIAQVDLHGKFTSVNDHYCEMVGRSRQELMSMRMQDLTHHADLSNNLDLFEITAKGGPPFDIEKRYLRPDGSTIWVSNHVTAVRQSDGQVVSVLAIAVDISARKQTEEQLRELNDTLEERVAERSAALLLYENIVRSDAAPVCAFDHDCRLIAFNQAHSDEFFRIYGKRVKMGDIFPDLFLPEQRQMIAGFMRRALAGEAFTVTEKFGDPDLIKPYWEVTYNPLRDEAGNIIAAFHHALDISARLRAEADLAETQEALRQAQKMEAVGQLTGGLAHDFNNLLAGISGSLEIIKVRLAQGRSNELAKFLAAAEDASRRAAALTHRLLAFSRRQTLSPKATDVKHVVNGMADMISRTVGPSIHIELVNDPELWATLIDPSQLENAILNLCLNARDAMPNGGTITIATANRSLERKAAKQHGIEPGQYISLCVYDTGMGMAPDVISKAFDPFFTTKPIGAGTGLGLSMIYGFAKQSGGSVNIQSEVGVGSMVCIYLPRHDGTVHLAPQNMELANAPRGLAGETVLVVDDEPTIRMLMGDVLNELGYRAIEAEDGAAGLRLLNSGMRIDLVISDVGLPGGMNGRQMADAARVTRADLKVLFITGYAEHTVLSHGHLEPGMHVMTKPFTMEAMASRIRELIHD